MFKLTNHSFLFVCVCGGGGGGGECGGYLCGGGGQVTASQDYSLLLNQANMINMCTLLQIKHAYTATN